MLSPLLALSFLLPLRTATALSSRSSPSAAQPVSPLSAGPSPTASPATPSRSTSSFPAATSVPPAPLLARCNSLSGCGGSGGESTLQASVVTITIVSTTSVPCYITTYVTDSTTITETVYSTETITSTKTSQGTVYVIHYSPTPVVMSTLVESVIQITNTWWSYWITSEGSHYDATSTGGGTVYGGQTTDCEPCNAKASGGYSVSSRGSSGGSWGGSSSVSGLGNSGSGSGNSSDNGLAWTHASVNAVSAAVAATTDGWGSAGSSAYSASTNSGSGTGWVSWNAGGRRREGWEIGGVVGVALAVVLVWEIGRVLC